MLVDDWMLGALRSNDAPDGVVASAEALADLRSLLGAARASQSHDLVPSGSAEWLADTLASRLSALPESGDEMLDACLALTTSSRALLEATGEVYSLALEATGHYLATGISSDRVENYDRLPSLARLFRNSHPRMAAVQAFLDAMSSDFTEVRLRGLAFGAVLCSRQGMKGLPAVEAHDVLAGRKRRSMLPAFCQEHGLLLPGQHCAATWVHHYLAGALGWAGAIGGGESTHPDLEDVFGAATIPLGWAVYAMALRFGSNSDLSMDGSPYPPLAPEPVHLVIRDARRFARRAALALPDVSPFLRSCGIQEADPIGSGWIQEEIAANLEALWEERAGLAAERDSTLPVEKGGWMGGDTHSFEAEVEVQLF